MAQKVLNYFIYILAKRDYTSQELIDKALDKGYSGAETKAAIASLKEMNYVDDHRFVETALHTYKGQKGYFWITQKLRRRKVPESIIEQELDGVEFEVDDNFKAKVQHKYKLESFADLDFKLKSKILNYISRQGFRNSMQILQGWERDAVDSHHQ